MKIVFVRANVDIRWMIVPPLGIGYLAAAAKKAGHEVVIYDAWLHGKGALAAIIEVEEMKPDLIGVQVFYDTVGWVSDFIGFRLSDAKIIVGGPQITAHPETTDVVGADEGVIGEGEIEFDPDTDCAEGGYFDVNSIPMPDWDSFDLPAYWPYMFNLSVPVRGRRPVNIQRTRGCPFLCLDGDTIINTVDGDFPISKLVGKDTKVLTRTKDRELIYADALNISKTGKNKQLVRVHFDNGETLDCTPDHLLKTFKNSNQHIELREYDVQADCLSPGDSVVSVHQAIDLNGYINLEYGKRRRKFKHRLVMESMIGREIGRKEHIHHIDRNRKNNSIDNLYLCPSVSAHYALHPEKAQRMREHNPAFKMNDEWRKKIGVGCTGKTRTAEQRLHYRESKLGTKNPHHKNYKPFVNHRVVRVEYLEERKDTYCMEVPGYDWFFANNILVHNCTFCAGHITHGYRVRFRDDDNVIAEIEYLRSKWGVDEIWFQDDNAIVNYKRGLELFKRLAPLKLHIRLPSGIRIENVTGEMAHAMKQAGVYYTGVGIETGNRRVMARIKKNLHYDQARRAIGILSRAGIQTNGFFIFGLPTETRDEMKDTVKYALSTKLHHAQFGTFIPYPGSEDANEKSLLPQEELIKIQRNATLRFYLRPRIIWNLIKHFRWSQLRAFKLHPWIKAWRNK